MRPFRFQAAAALELRTAEDERARLHLGRTRLEQHEANQRVTRAREAAVEAVAELDRCQAEGSDVWTLEWHQSWIARQRREVQATERAAALSAIAVTRATASANEARQRRRALERLRDRAHERYRLEVTRHETREMNELANVRFVLGQDAEKGLHHDD